MIMIKNISISFIFLIYLVTTGCNLQKPVVIGNYIKWQTRIDSLTIAAFDPVIQKNDILYINFSVTGSEVAQKQIMLYNLPTNTNAVSNIALQGFLVSPKGYIDIPSLGKIDVAGKTKQEVIDVLYEKIKVYILVPPVITVRIINFKVFLEGEVGKPGLIEVPNEVLTLQQAIAIAGGTTLFANLSDVEVMRSENGTTKIVHIDLRGEQIYTTHKDFYYLKQNDYIAIKPNKEKILSSNQSTARTVSYATTAITALLAIFTIFR
jgi:polysaccharide biosynthesis/export protein